MCSSSTGEVEDHSTLFHTGRSGTTRSFLQPVGGLQMVQSFAHIPVLSDEVVSSFAPVPAGVVVDATVGGGGHSAALLTAYAGMQIIGLDRDPVALEAAAARLAPFGERVTRADLGCAVRSGYELPPARPGRKRLLLPQ